jgi:hypothetical protein
MRFPGFFSGSEPSESPIASSARTVNFYVEKVGTDGPQSKTAFYPTPGQQAWITAASSGGVLVDVGGRGGIWTGTRAFVAIGAGLYEIFADATIIRRGTLAQDANPAQFAYNGPTGGQLGIASGTNGYCYVLATNVLTQVLAGECHQIAMLDEYFLALNQTSGKLRLSNLNDGLTWDPTQFALRSAQPDPWVALTVNAPDIWLSGSNTGDVWYDAGTSPFPLAARAGLNITNGIAAPFSQQVSNGQLIWLASDKDGAGRVVATQGYGARPISTPELDTAIAGYARTAAITDAESLLFEMQGHNFYVLRFPTANASWLYDLGTGIWTEIGPYNTHRGDYDVWSPRFHLYAFGRHLVGGAGSGTIFGLDVIYNTEADGASIRRLRRSPVLVSQMRRMGLASFELLIESGIASQSGQGSDPVVMARFSPDGGKTWGNQRQASAGAVGLYQTRVRWTRLGSPRLWVAEVSMTDPISWRIIDAFINNDADAGRQAA